MKSNFVTRDLSRQESLDLLSALHLKLGNTNLVEAALSVIAERGLGIFAVEKKED